MHSIQEQSWGIHWFRRDLRIPGNLALRENWKQNEGRVLGVFCFDSKFLGRKDFSHKRFAFFLKSLSALREEFRRQGGDLLVVDQLPMDFFSQLLSKCSSPPSLITWSRDYEPFAVIRDQTVHDFLLSKALRVHTDRDHLILEPQEVLKEKGFYQIYTPFCKKWLEEFKKPAVLDRVKQANGAKYFDRMRNNKLEKIFSLNWTDKIQNCGELFPDALEKFTRTTHSRVSIPLPEAGFPIAFSKLLEFKNRVSSYAVQRNIPSEVGTSGLSIYLKNGSLTTAQILGELNMPATMQNQFLKEIVWREFYYSILSHRPDVEVQSFLPQYRNLAWENNEKYFKKWCAGQTGFPIVDAGMRQLNQTGWMHNRVRMIVASFLCKDLLIDWRWGENYFMQHLLDGDLAPNNGGWQWSASTGCDPQPYFRIFNPWLQAERFDPEAIYIKRWIPELINVSAKEIHSENASRGSAYPKPVIDHRAQKDRALRMYKSAKI